MLPRRHGPVRSEVSQRRVAQGNVETRPDLAGKEGGTLLGGAGGLHQAPQGLRAAAADNE